MWGRRGWQSRGRWGAQSGEGHTAMARSAGEGEIVWSHLNMGKICLPSLGAPVTCFQLTWWWGISKSWRLCRSWSLSDNRENIRKIKLRKGWGQGRAGAISDYQPASQQMWSTAELRLTLREEEREESSITVTQLDWINSKYPTTAVTSSTFTTKRTKKYHLVEHLRDFGVSPEHSLWYKTEDQYQSFDMNNSRSSLDFTVCSLVTLLSVGTQRSHHITITSPSHSPSTITNLTHFCLN